MRARFTKEDLGCYFTPDEGKTIFRLDVFVPEPQVTMVQMGGAEITCTAGISEFKDFRRLVIQKPRVRKAKEPAATKTRKQRSDKGKHHTPRKPGTREGAAGNPEKPDPIGRTQEYKRLEFCNACGREGLLMTFHLDPEIGPPQHWVASCPRCSAAVCIANGAWDRMAEIKAP